MKDIGQGLTPGPDLEFMCVVAFFASFVMVYLGFLDEVSKTLKIGRYVIYRYCFHGNNR